MGRGKVRTDGASPPRFSGFPKTRLRWQQRSLTTITDMRKLLDSLTTVHGTTTDVERYYRSLLVLGEWKGGITMDRQLTTGQTRAPPLRRRCCLSTIPMVLRALLL